MQNKKRVLTRKNGFLLISIIFINLFLLSSCGFITGNNFDPGENWQSRESEHFRFYYREDSFADTHIDEIIQIEEEAFQHIIDSLEINYHDKTTIYIYDSPADAGWDHIQGFAYCWDKFILTIYSEAGKSIGVKGAACHEITHVMTWNSIGKPGTNFLDEGTAVAMDGEWHAASDVITGLHQWTKKYLAEGTLPSISQLVNDWDSINGLISYPVSGSFVTYLIERFGVANFKKLFIEADKTNFESEFFKIYHLDFNSIIKDWKLFVQKN